MRFAVLVFPGTWSDGDCQFALRDILGHEADLIWHRETSLDGYDALIFPGGFSYGDYLRCGAIARFAPIMPAVQRHADAGRPIFGSCNGFQILCEAGLLPGVLLRNESLQFRCRPQHVRVERNDTGFSSACGEGQALMLPISHGEGNYFADDEALAMLQAENQIVFRYCDADGNVSDESNPNGSRDNIAGVINAAGNVLGMMPHPERASEALLGGEDGLSIWRSMIERWG
ncbi:MAG TPA: phosphoribosylformylglycinamidine synthase subunit PurQ [Dehalococcoidia bacterium]|nr:phosphoribosylformylglycinamidine synthase subunit PurQ [Dehalococcoidia bacterium]